MTVSSDFPDWLRFIDRGASANVVFGNVTGIGTATILSVPASGQISLGNVFLSVDAATTAAVVVNPTGGGGNLLYMARMNPGTPVAFAFDGALVPVGKGVQLVNNTAGLSVFLTLTYNVVA